MKAAATTFLDRYSKLRVSKLTKFTFLLPLIIVLIAVAVIVGVGETTGNYTSAVGIGIDFQGGTMLTVNNLADNDELDAKIDDLADVIEGVRDEHGSSVTISYTQTLSGSGGISASLCRINVWEDTARLRISPRVLSSDKARL